MRDVERVAIHYRRLPDHTRIYDQRVIHRDPHVIVTLSERLRMDAPMTAGDRVMLEDGSLAVWFTFPETWHDIGRFYRADGTYTGLYANILTPPVLEPATWHTTDLFLDVWWPDGGELQLLDEDEFEAAVTARHLDRSTAERARAEAHDILHRAGAGSWPPPVVEEWSLTRALERVGEAD